MKEKIESVKNHFRKNRKVYIAAGIGVTVGFVGTSLYIKSAHPGLIQTAIAFWKSEITQVATYITIDAPGNSGNVIQDLRTGTIYPSQNAAAKALGVNRGSISTHLNGKSPTADGHTFTKLIDGKNSHKLQTV